MVGAGTVQPVWVIAIIGGSCFVIAGVGAWNSQGNPGTIGPIASLVVGVFGAGLILLGSWLWYTGRRA